MVLVRERFLQVFLKNFDTSKKIEGISIFQFSVQEFNLKLDAFLVIFYYS